MLLLRHSYAVATNSERNLKIEINKKYLYFLVILFLASHKLYLVVIYRYFELRYLADVTRTWCYSCYAIEI